MNFDKAFERLISHEGGYVNDPHRRLVTVVATASFKTQLRRISSLLVVSRPFLS